MHDSNYPLGVSARDFDEDRTPETLHIEDVLDVPVEIRGLYLEARVSADFRRYGRNGEISLESIEIGPDVWLNIQATTGQGVFSDDLLKLDIDSLKSRHARLYEEFTIACERAALKRAAIVPDSLWRRESEDV